MTESWRNWAGTDGLLVDTSGMQRVIDIDAEAGRVTVQAGITLRHYQTAATLRERYPQWDRFQAVRARLDPDGVFANDYTRRVLGPVGTPAPR